MAAVVGLSAESFPLGELFWGVRRFLEILAEPWPLVLVVDDIHWAEATLLDLLEQLSTGSDHAPVLLVCSARHDLLERRPFWAGDGRGERITLNPLGPVEASQIVENLLGQAGIPDDIEGAIVRAADGNPLYLEQMLSMLLDSGALRLDQGEWRRADELVEIPVPPTIEALLAARLDTLSRDERALVDRGSVIGVVFQEAAVGALAPEPLRASLPAQLISLDHKQLVHPDPDNSAGEGSHRFHHALIRDAAYVGLLKRVRAEYHEQFVDWADRANKDRNRGLEFEEILGYHLEQARHYLADLGPLDAHGIGLGVRAAEKLASSGRRALARGDMAAAANLLQRSAAVLQVDDGRRRRLLPDLGEALMEVGRFADADRVLSEAVELAGGAGERPLELEAGLMKLLVERYGLEAEDWTGRVMEATSAAIPVFESSHDEAALTKAWRLRVVALSSAGMYGAAADAARQVMDHARRSGDTRQEARGSSSYALTSVFGPTPVPEAIERCRSILERLTDDRRTEGLVQCALAELYGMAGEFDLARETYKAARANLEQLGQSVLAASTSTNSWRVEFEAGDLAAAEAELRRDYEALTAMGERFLLPTVATRLAAVLAEVGRWEEAESLVAAAEELVAPDDVDALSSSRSVRARVLAHAGHEEEAAASARAAVALLRPTEGVLNLADALADAGSVLRIAGMYEEATKNLIEAAELYEAKGYLRAAARARAMLEGVAA
jgi:tetratricopeptide (TPR) repeat protein